MNNQCYYCGGISTLEDMNLCISCAINRIEKYIKFKQYLYNKGYSINHKISVQRMIVNLNINYKTYLEVYKHLNKDLNINFINDDYNQTNYIAFN